MRTTFSASASPVSVSTLPNVRHFLTHNCHHHLTFSVISDVPVADLDAIFSQLSKSKDELMVSSEVIGNSPIRPDAYTGLGDVVLSDYYEALKAAFTSSGINDLQGLKDRCTCQLFHEIKHAR